MNIHKLAQAIYVVIYLSMWHKHYIDQPNYSRRLVRKGILKTINLIVPFYLFFKGGFLIYLVIHVNSYDGQLKKERG